MTENSFSKYNKIGIGYNSTRQADPYLTERLFCLLHPQKDKIYLDLGCGTGNYTLALANKGFKFFGVDPSDQMLGEAKSRNQEINWIKGTAEQIPTADNWFDGMVATLTIHHWLDLKKAFSEIHRVLADNGRLVLFTSTPEQMKGYWLNHYFPKMLHASIVQMPSLADIEMAIAPTELEVINIEKYFIKDDLQDCFLYVGKNNPVCYFDEAIRRGISSFSSFGNRAEVKQGLTKLRNDLDNKLFEKIRDQYANELGDYLFVAIKKRGRS